MKKEDWFFLKNESFHRKFFGKIYSDLSKKGKEVSPRGEKILEIENYSFSIPPYVRFQNFRSRKLNIQYIKDEFLWYLKGDRFDLSILKKAKLWNEVVNYDGSINSNYGQYIFGRVNQFQRAASFLIKDRDSRRACIMILNQDHLSSMTKDYPCTYGLSFRIRDNFLNMTVQMRSQDAIYGMGNDIPAFSFIHEMMLHTLRKNYPSLEYGNYFHFVNSFHVYEKHFTMLKEIVKDAEDGRYMLILCPQISCSDEVDYLLNLNYSNIPSKFLFTRWLTKDLKKD